MPRTAGQAQRKSHAETLLLLCLERYSAIELQKEWHFKMFGAVLARAREICVCVCKGATLDAMNLLRIRTTYSSAMQWCWMFPTCVARDRSDGATACI
jgi:hypothetical protein